MRLLWTISPTLSRQKHYNTQLHRTSGDKLQVLNVKSRIWPSLSARARSCEREREKHHLSWSICRSRPSQGSLKLKRGGFHLQSLIFINSGFQIEIETWGWHNNSVNHSLLISNTHTHTSSLCPSTHTHTPRPRDKWKAWPVEIWGLSYKDVTA